MISPEHQERRHTPHVSKNHIEDAKLASMLFLSMEDSPEGFSQRTISEVKKSIVDQRSKNKPTPKPQKPR